MNKYIIKNCPSLNQARNLCNEIISTCCADYNMGKEVVWCKDCTDCLLKRIVKKCKTHLNFCDNCDGDVNIDCIDCTQGGKAIMSNYILELLEIEECEE